MKKLFILLSIAIALLVGCTSYWITTFDNEPCSMRDSGLTLCLSVPNQSWQFATPGATPTAETGFTPMPSATATPEFCTDTHLLYRTTVNLNLRNNYGYKDNGDPIGAVILTIPRWGDLPTATIRPNSNLWLDTCITKSLPNGWSYVHYHGYVRNAQGVYVFTEVSGFVVTQFITPHSG